MTVSLFSSYLAFSYFATLGLVLGQVELVHSIPPVQAQRLPSAERTLFPDYDCRRPPPPDGDEATTTTEGGALWDQWRRAIRNQATWLNEENVAYQSRVMNFYVQKKEEGKKNLNPRDANYYYHHHVEALMDEDCAVGSVYSSVIIMLKCWHEGDACYHEHERIVQEKFPPFQTLIGTEWPILETIAETDWTDTPARDDVKITCDYGQSERTVIDWSAFRNLIFDHPDDWYDRAVRVAYGHEIEQNQGQAAHECPLGFLMANVVKALICASTESICFHAHAGAIDHVLRAMSFHAIFGGGWPLATLLVHVRRTVKRHNFALEFEPEELMNHGTSASSQTMRNLVEAIGGSLAQTELIMDLKLSSDHVLKKRAAEEPSSRPVVTTMVYGVKFVKYVEAFLRRVVAVGIPRFVLWCLDEGALNACSQVSTKIKTPSSAASDSETSTTTSSSSRIYCVRGYQHSILNKFAFPLVLLNRLKTDVLWIDFDVFLFRNPLTAPSLTGFSSTPVSHEVEHQHELQHKHKKEDHADDFDIAISGSFLTDCVTSGVVYFRNRDRVKYWLLEVLSWMYQHPYEHDQKCVSAFLGAGERVTFPEQMPKRAFFNNSMTQVNDLVRWKYLDPETEFVTSRNVPDGGWFQREGREMYLFHFLHGDSDASLGSRGWTRDVFGSEYTDYFEVFYYAASTFTTQEETGAGDTSTTRTTRGLTEHGGAAVMKHQQQEQEGHQASSQWKTREALGYDIDDLHGWRNSFRIKNGMARSERDLPRPYIRKQCNETVPMNY
ncbi:unnamed protein product [Amoebophrya sp. A25]|nr:unnamed protein product [Amoebophrya sp. A25]|eukprot:GSA25T00025771001.1